MNNKLFVAVVIGGVFLFLLISQSKELGKSASVNLMRKSLEESIGKNNADKIDDALLLEMNKKTGAGQINVIIQSTDKNVIESPTFISKYTNFIAGGITQDGILDLARQQAVKKIFFDSSDATSNLYWAVPSNELTPHITASNAGEGVKVCVIDDGLSNNIYHNVIYKEEGSESGIDVSHGTAVVGVINSNDDTYRGLAPGAEIIFFLRGSMSETMLKIEECVTRGAEIISLSFMFNQYDPGTVEIGYSTCDDNGYATYFNDLIAQQDIIIVAGVGNAGYKGSYGPPACASQVISVGAVTDSHYKVAFSSIGHYVDIMAPGYNIYSTTGTDSFTKHTGTSFSAPFVAGAIAVLKSISNQSNDNIIQAIYDTAEPAYCRGPYSSGGMCDPIAAGNGVINTYQACLQLEGARSCDPYFELNLGRPILTGSNDCGTVAECECIADDDCIPSQTCQMVTILDEPYILPRMWCFPTTTSTQPCDDTGLKPIIFGWYSHWSTVYCDENNFNSYSCYSDYLLKYSSEYCSNICTSEGCVYETYDGFVKFRGLSEDYIQSSIAFNSDCNGSDLNTFTFLATSPTSSESCNTRFVNSGMYAKLLSNISGNSILGIPCNSELSLYKYLTTNDYYLCCDKLDGTLKYNRYQLSGTEPSISIDLQKEIPCEVTTNITPNITPPIQPPDLEPPPSGGGGGGGTSYENCYYIQNSTCVSRTIHTYDTCGDDEFKSLEECNAVLTEELIADEVQTEQSADGLVLLIIGILLYKNRKKGRKK